eukprot:5916914-Amphidinium_carterae.1
MRHRPTEVRVRVLLRSNMLALAHRVKDSLQWRREETLSGKGRFVQTVWTRFGPKQRANGPPLHRQAVLLYIQHLRDA